MLGTAGLYVLFTSPQQLLHSLNGLNAYLPIAISSLLKQTLAPIGHNPHGQAGLAVILSILALLYTTSGGIQNLVKATNKAYEVEETRGLIKRRLTSVALSVLMLAIGGLVALLLVMQGSALHRLGFPNFVATVFPYARFPILIFLIAVVLSAIYRYAPNRQEPSWQWVSWGASAATILWLAVTALFFIYAQNFGSFNKTYGSFAGIIVLMTWFNLSSFIVLLGAQVNKKLETVAE